MNCPLLHLETYGQYFEVVSNTTNYAKKTEISSFTRLEMDSYPKDVGMATFSSSQSQT